MALIPYAGKDRGEMRLKFNRLATIGATARKIEPVLVVNPEPEPTARKIYDKPIGPERSQAGRARLIIGNIAEKYGLSFDEIMAHRRLTKIVHARQEAMSEVSDHLPMWSLPRIGRFFGDRDHTTVLHAIRCHKARMAGEVYIKPRRRATATEIVLSAEDARP